MRYLIHTPKVSANKLSGPFDPIETLLRAKLLREARTEFFITDENGIVVVSDDQFRSSTGSND
jgi:hypothetical protein